MPRTPTTRLLPLAAAGLLAWSGGALAQDQRPAQPQHEGSQSQQTLQNNSATRALDRAAGTNVSGAYPSQADGTPENPPGTAATRALDRAAGTNTSGAYPGNEGKKGDSSDPPGTAAGRAMDRAAGTNTSGAYPNQSDGTAANPPGTAAGRAMDRANEKADGSRSEEMPKREETPPGTRPDQRSDSGRLLLAQNALGTEPGVTDRGAKLSGPEAQGGTGNNSGRVPGPRTGTAGNTASQPAPQREQPASPSSKTTEAPSLGTEEVAPPGANPSRQERPSSAN
ncbi:MAG TPA: hypothetical protein VNZ61_19980 [Roseomonas sp.]|nr:hypothetical protein [Roseomonas sp.]